MAIKKFTIKYDDIFIYDDALNLKDVIEFSFVKERNNFDFLDSNNKRHLCQFLKINSSDDYFFGKFGEIKSSWKENGVAVLDDRELENIEFKYHVQFYIDYLSHSMVFIYNSNATCFEEAFKEYLAQNPNLMQEILDQIYAKYNAE